MNREVVTNRTKYQTGDVSFHIKCPACGEKNNLMWNEAGKSYIMTGWCEHLIGARPCGFTDFDKTVVRMKKDGAKPQGIVELGEGSKILWAEVEMVFDTKAV